jgi:hypothetical protein
MPTCSALAAQLRVSHSKHQRPLTCRLTAPLRSCALSVSSTLCRTVCSTAAHIAAVGALRVSTCGMIATAAAAAAAAAETHSLVGERAAECIPRWLCKLALALIAVHARGPN